MSEENIVRKLFSTLQSAFPEKRRNFETENSLSLTARSFGTASKHAGTTRNVGIAHVTSEKRFQLTSTDPRYARIALNRNNTNFPVQPIELCAVH